MAAKLLIRDGNPIWLSASIVPSRDTVVSPNSAPTTATPSVTSTDVFVYVKVENTGTVDFTTCACTALGAWTAPVFFAGFLGSTTATKTETQGGVTFTSNSIGNSLSGPGISFSFGLSASGRRAWAWSPDGRCFAFVGSPNGNDWFLTIVALQPITRSNGTTIAKNTVAATANGVYAGTNAAQWWNNANFAWAGSKAVISSGAYSAGSGFLISLACPEAPSPNTWGDLFPSFPGQIDWAFLVSPCGGTIGFAPKKLNATAPPQDFFQVSTATAKVVPFRKNNASTSISTTGPNPSITTLQHAANGVRINTGNGTTIDVDDPECSFAPGGVVVQVDRVKASTLPTANLGVIGVGSSVLSTLMQAKSQWVQVVNQNGWANQSERHWCLLAQAYSVDGTTIPRPWNGQAASPPAFPVTKDECAQRNIEILP